MTATADTFDPPTMLERVRDARPVDADPPRGTTLDALHARRREASPTDTVQVLGTPNGERATKRHERTEDGWQTDGFNRRLRYYRRTPREVSSIFDLGKLLGDLEESRDWFVVRGKPTGAEPCHHRDGTPLVRRNKKPKDGDPCEHDADECPPHFQDAERRWMMLDIDDLDVPDSRPGRSADAPDPLELAEKRIWIVDQLPEWLQGCVYFYQWSSSAGLDGWTKVSIHLWFWLDRPAYGPSLREYFDQWSDRSGVPIDTSLFHGVQPHYTAAPLFDECSDPLEGDRSGLAYGGDHEASPPPEILDAETYREREARREREREKQRQANREAARYTSDARQATARESYARKALEKACESIEAAGKGNRHQTIYQESASVAGIVQSPDLPTGALPESEARRALIAAGKTVLPSKRHNEVERTVGDAFDDAEPRDLSGVGVPDWATHTGAADAGESDLQEDEPAPDDESPDESPDETTDTLDGKPPATEDGEGSTLDEVRDYYGGGK